jgi:hypothetical protein
MIIISHRGNTKGSDISIENNPNHIKNLIYSNIYTEVDVWFIDEKFYLGHDAPQYEIDLNFLKNNLLWCHAKNLNALKQLLEQRIVCFWHQNDDFTLTSNNYIWTYPDKPINYSSIIVDTTPSWRNKNYNCYGVCVDYL